MKKYQFDKNFFKKIDTEEKSYFLGLLYADGSLRKEGVVRLQLSEIDGHIIEKFKHCLNSTHPIKKVITPSTRKNQDCFSFYSKEVVQDLINLGCLINKTFTLNFPKDVPENLMWHFIRGNFDGDGGWYYSKLENRFFAIFSCASESFILSLKEFLIKNNINCFIQKQNNCYKLTISGNKKIRRFATSLYNNSSIYFFRKKEQYEKLNNIVEDNNKSSNIKILQFKNDQLINEFDSLRKAQSKTGISRKTIKYWIDKTGKADIGGYQWILGN